MITTRVLVLPKQMRRHDVRMRIRHRYSITTSVLPPMANITVMAFSNAVCVRVPEWHNNSIWKSFSPRSTNTVIDYKGALVGRWLRERERERERGEGGMLYEYRCKSACKHQHTKGLNLYICIYIYICVNACMHIQKRVMDACAQIPPICKRVQMNFWRIKLNTCFCHNVSSSDIFLHQNAVQHTHAYIHAHQQYYWACLYPCCEQNSLAPWFRCRISILKVLVIWMVKNTISKWIKWS